MNVVSRRPQLKLKSKYKRCITSPKILIANHASGDTDIQKNKAAKAGRRSRRITNKEGRGVSEHLKSGSRKETLVLPKHIQEVVKEVSSSRQVASVSRSQLRTAENGIPVVADPPLRNISSPSNNVSGTSPPITADEIQLYLHPRRDEREKLDRILRKCSVAYPKRCQTLPRVYQHTQRYRHRVNADYPFSSPRAHEQYPNYTTKLTDDTKVKPPLTPVTQTTTNTSSTSSLPPLPRTPVGKNKLRRPMTFSPRPLEEHDDGFQALANRLDLKPLIIDDSPSKTLRFYQEAYPLLLQKLLAEDRNKYNCAEDRRSKNPSLGPDGRKRGADVGMRLLGLDSSLDELDKQTDGYFRTELRSDTFDPRKWPWNRNRYQIQ